MGETVGPRSEHRGGPTTGLPVRSARLPVHTHHVRPPSGWSRIAPRVIPSEPPPRSRVTEIGNSGSS
ncbi:hypothetical protein B005_2853 [Nocardiopsis alba ATCC BAA-2165]|uniref:Uncharacterized protein n=1 Tax=Nocardiopsis alba (strain ATCC BAA-2165 / BE74) TaxID=1205910 RepID=J7L9K5_NOCAA|nr:hypothetical protein B005_2853 [Nocardiopsis alba ATCC BAA-2165]